MSRRLVRLSRDHRGQHTLQRLLFRESVFTYTTTQTLVNPVCNHEDGLTPSPTHQCSTYSDALVCVQPSVTNRAVGRPFMVSSLIGLLTYPSQPQASVPPQSLQQRVSGGVPCRAVACRGGTQGGQTFYHSFPELCPCGRASGCLSGPGRALTEESGITPQLSRLKQRP